MLWDINSNKKIKLSYINTMLGYQVVAKLTNN